jgi:hypothetical protein
MKPMEILEISFLLPQKIKFCSVISVKACNIISADVKARQKAG